MSRVRHRLWALALIGLAVLALGGCKLWGADEPPPPRLVDRACEVAEPYRGDIARVRPPEAQAHLDRHNRGLGAYCAGQGNWRSAGQ